MAISLTTRAIILRRTNYGEADRILTILTPEHGQLAVMARAVRRAKSKLAGGIELFAICELGLVKSSSATNGMWTLTSSRIIVFYDQLMLDYDRLQFGYEAIKQISRLSSAVDTPELYQVLAGVLASLNNHLIDLRLVKAWFSLHLARLKGSELNLLTDSNGMKLVEGVSYDYDIAEQAFVYLDGGGRYDTETIKLLRLLSANPASILTRLKIENEVVLTNVLYLASLAEQGG